MQEKEFDDELIRQMLDWLSRGMDADRDFPGLCAPDVSALTEQDYEFLRQLGIALSTEEHTRRSAH